MSNTIHYHHIGGRGGTSPLQNYIPAIFRKNIELTLYDADEGVTGNLGLQQLKTQYSNVKFYNKCVGSRSEQSPFYLYKHRPCSSALKFNEEYKNFTFIPGTYGNCIFGKTFIVDKEETLDLVSFQSIIEQNSDFVDYLSLDVQGLEYDIIEGSKDYISNNVVGIATEVGLIELYKGQKIFADIDLLLREMGYELIVFNQYKGKQSRVLPIGFCGQGIPCDGEVFYVKKLEQLHNFSLEKILKWSFYCLIFGQVSRCLDGLELANNIYPDCNLLTTDNAESIYLSLLFELWKIYNYNEKCFLHCFDEILSKDQLEIKRYLSNHYLENIDNFLAIKKSSSTEIEKLMIKYQLHGVAKILKKNRKQDIKYFFEALESSSSWKF